MVRIVKKSPFTNAEKQARFRAKRKRDHAAILYSGISSGAKITAMKFAHEGIKEPSWSDFLRVAGSKATASRHKAEIDKDKAQ